MQQREHEVILQYTFQTVTFNSVSASLFSPLWGSKEPTPTTIPSETLSMMSGFPALLKLWWKCWLPRLLTCCRAPTLPIPTMRFPLIPMSLVCGVKCKGPDLCLCDFYHVNPWKWSFASSFTLLKVRENVKKQFLMSTSGLRGRWDAAK